MKTVAIINEKGGTAKTTTTVSLAAALGEIGQSVLVVDLDGQAASSRWLGIEGDSRLADAMIAGEGLEPIPNVLPNVDLAPASGKIDSVAHELRPTQGGQLRRVLAEVQAKKSYDYILMDCPPSLGNRLIGNAMLAATHALVPVETSILALDGLRILLTMLRDIRQGFDHEIELMGVLACRYDARTRLSRLILSELHRALPGKVFRTVIHNTIRIQECPAVVKSILEYAPDCPASKDYRMLAQELVTGNVEGEHVEEVEDLAGCDAVDHSDQQTILDFRHRAAEFFGRPIEDEPTTSVSAEEKTDEEIENVVVDVIAETEEGDWPVAPPSQTLRAVEEPHEENPPLSAPEEEPMDEFIIAVAEEPSVEPPAEHEDDPLTPLAQTVAAYRHEHEPPNPYTADSREIRGDEEHWKARRNAKLIAAGLVLLFAAGALLVQRTRLFPRSAEANHDSAVQTTEPSLDPASAGKEETQDSVMEIFEEDAQPQPADSPTIPAIAKAADPVAPKAAEPKPQTKQSPPVPKPAPSDTSTGDPSTGSETAGRETDSETPAGDKPAGKPTIAEEKPAPDVEPISLTFSGMMGTGGNYSATINGRWLHVGDQILDATLVDVDPMFAEVEWRNRRYRLRMGEESILRVGEGEPGE
ncbi:MAG: AAA family ATPase [Phycisphaerae bacterium]|nr:AAA family ATPase [Phycisphaerae bacterium]